MSYYQDALLAITHRISTDAILHGNAQGESQWGYRFIKGLTEFATYHDSWSARYQTWLQNNANAAWSNRDSLNITWNDWTTPTPVPSYAKQGPLGKNGRQRGDVRDRAAGTGNVNGNGGLALDVAGAVVDQATPNGGPSQIWKLQATAVGYFTLTSGTGNLVLESPSMTQGDQLAVAEPSGSATQEWTLAPAP